MDASEVVADFARALDRDDFQAARELLAEDCEYDTGDGIVRGRDAVIVPYQEVSEKCKRTFDAIAYESRVVAARETSATVLYTDKIRRGEHHHEFKCHQVLDVDDTGRIVRIQHREIDGERDALNAFFRRAGVAW
jgi:limonene-1,2-epoxide hydrolase